jgi:hypothetical protein
MMYEGYIQCVLDRMTGSDMGHMTNVTTGLTTNVGMGLTTNVSMGLATRVNTTKIPNQLHGIVIKWQTKDGKWVVVHGAGCGIDSIMVAMKIVQRWIEQRIPRIGHI